MPYLVKPQLNSHVNAKYSSTCEILCLEKCQYTLKVFILLPFFHCCTKLIVNFIVQQAYFWHQEATGNGSVESQGN